MSPLNAVVAAIGELHLEGNITPHAWYQAPALQFANGKANLAAITLLADVMYWYRPTILRDEATGRAWKSDRSSAQTNFKRIIKSGEGSLA